MLLLHINVNSHLGISNQESFFAFAFHFFHTPTPPPPILISAAFSSRELIHLLSDNLFNVLTCLDIFQASEASNKVMSFKLQYA